MMCAERAELDKAESLLLLLGSCPLKSHCGPGLVFKTSYSLQLHGSAYGMCACLDLHVHVFFCCGCCSFEQCDPFLPPHLKKKKKKIAPQSASCGNKENLIILMFVTQHDLNGSKRETRKSTVIRKPQNT